MYGYTLTHWVAISRAPAWRSASITFRIASALAATAAWAVARRVSTPNDISRLVRNRLDTPDPADGDGVLGVRRVLRTREIGKADGAGESDDGEPGGNEKQQAFHEEPPRSVTT